VDATYPADLKQLNELNFARFDAKLEQRIAELRAYLDVRLAQFDAKLDTKLAAFDAKIEKGFKEQRSWFVGVYLSLLATIVALGGLVMWRT
jgi:hypothetical protein